VVENPTGGRKGNQRLVLLAIGVAVVLLYFALTRRQDGGFDWARFLAVFRDIHWGWFAASVFVVLLTYLGRALRWQLMVRPIRAESNLWNLLVATIIGFTAVVLFGRAGELVRPYLIAKKEKFPFTSQVAVWVLERIYDLLSVLLLFGFALSRISSSSTRLGGRMEWVLEAGGHMVGVMGTLCLVLLVVFGLFPQFVERQLLGALQVLPERFRDRIGGLVQAFLAGTSSTRRGSFVFLLVAYTFAEWFLIVLCFFCVFKAMPATAGFGFVDTLIVVGFVAFGSSVQVPGIGGGMQVAAILVLTELFRLPLETASGIAILLWVVSFLTVVPVGLGLAVREGIELRKVMHSKEFESV
jgi:uncharacterized membrane protein YbhN (UPF0104 family)